MLDVLFVCTANQCRSPMAEVLLRDAVERNGGKVRVSSAGRLRAGEPAVAHAQTAAGQLGLDLSSHTSRELGRRIVDDADLILTMERDQLRRIAVDYSGAFYKTFTLPEFVRRTIEAHPTESFDDLLEQLNEGRSTRDLAGADAADDIDDPIGGSLDDFVATRTLLSKHIDEVAGMLAVVRTQRIGPHL